jgi:flagellar basal body rod protein FlgG
MLSGLYSAATALSVAEHNQELIAHNLAHINVPGFRRSVVAIESFDNTLDAYYNADSPLGHGSQIAEVATDFSPGNNVETGRKLDVAIIGDGFFTVQGPEGPLYTRNGGWQVTETGAIVTGTGMPVLAQDGPLALPDGLFSDQLLIAPDGAVSAGGQQIGQLRLVTFADLSQLVPAGTTLFTAPPEVIPQEGNVLVRQGAREQSNVSPVGELVQMIIAMRQHEAAQRVLHTIDQAIQQNTNPQA